MSGFFNTEAANFIQHVSICLEFLGLVLTFIEVMHPERADKIEKAIDWTGMFFMHLASEFHFFMFYELLEQPKYDKEEKLKAMRDALGLNRKVIGNIIMIPFLVQLPLLGFILYFLGFDKVCNNIVAGFKDFISALIPIVTLAKIISITILVLVYILVMIILVPIEWLIIPFVLPSMLAKLLALPIKFLNRITDGRALGTIGIILALLGFLGEGYQLLTIYFGK